MVQRYRALSFPSTDVGAFQSSFFISQTAQGLTLISKKEQKLAFGKLIQSMRSASRYC
jgi:hypothetical protein